MTEEIKEISDLQRCADNNKSHLLLDFEIKNILRYITNLQKENKINNDLIPCFKNREKELKKQINVLQKENERLKKKITFNEKSRRKMQQSLMEQIETYKIKELEE